MEHRGGDPNDDIDDSFDSAVLIGGYGDADLWLFNTGVLLCQYENYSNHYISYWPANAIYRSIKGGVMDKADFPIEMEEGKFYRWMGSSAVTDIHDEIGIAIYLAVFQPDLFTEAERADLLGSSLTTQGEME